MAEFWCFIERFKQNDADFKSLYQKLKDQQEECVNNVNRISAQLSDYKDLVGYEKCYRDKKDFDEYFQAYSNQFVEKGIEICQKSIEDEMNTQKQQGEAKNNCLKFYYNNLLVLKDNTVRKLKNLVEKTSMSQL
ncbi:hypothetical protein ABPG74_008673 [Tetrahymena malaccensis]